MLPAEEPGWRARVAALRAWFGARQPAVVIVAGLVVAIHAVVFATWPVGGYSDDSRFYLSMMGGWKFADLHPNGYPLFLTALRTVGEAAWLPYLANHVLTLASSWLLFCASRRTWSPRVSALWVLAMTLCTRALTWDTWLLSESLSLFLLSVQLWLVRRPGGICALRWRDVVLLGLVSGYATWVRSIAFLVMPALLMFVRGASWRAWAGRVAVVGACVAVFALVAALGAHAATGDRAPTRALGWNLLAGHPETARCRVEPGQSDEMQAFCAAFEHTPEGTRGFAMWVRRASPGAMLLRKHGGFRAAGPELERLMWRRIRARPGRWVVESLGNSWDWVVGEDRWYVASAADREFVHDPGVVPIFTRRWSDPTGHAGLDNPPSVWMLEAFRVPRGVFMVALALLLVVGLCRWRDAPWQVLLVAPLVGLGTLLVAFAEARYFAPIELTCFFAVPSMWRRARQEEAAD